MRRSAMWTVLASLALIAGPASADPPTYKGRPITQLLSSGGHTAFWARIHTQPIGRSSATPAPFKGDDGDPFIDPDAPLTVPPLSETGGEPGPFTDDGTNVFASDPCSDPFPPSRRKTVQSETELAVLNSKHSHGKKIVVGFNDSGGFYDNRQGLSGFAYSTDGGKSFIDGDGLPPLGATDRYFGDPVLVVHNRTETFYYASIYGTVNGVQTLSVNRGHFQKAPPQTAESMSNTRCKGNPAAFGIPDPPPANQERIIWEPPVIAVSEAELGGGPGIDPALADALDKEWLFVDQRTGVLYLTYTRFGADGSTPLQMVRSYDMGRTWTPPSVIVPNLDDTFNQASQPFVTSTGRVVVTWFSRTFLLAPPFPEISQRVEAAFSDDDGQTFGPTVTVAPVNPQGEPPGYNRGRATILNAPYIFAERRGQDGEGDDEGDDDGHRPGNIYITYFDGTAALPTPAKSANIKLSRSRTNGATWDAPVIVNSDRTNTSHVFPSVQVDKDRGVHVAWSDRRLDAKNNVLTDVWAATSNNQGQSFGKNVRVTNVSTSWFARADARPNFGDYNSSELINFEQFVTTWADARFPEGTYVPPTCTPAPPPGGTCAPRLAGTPDTFFAKVPSGGDDHHDD